MAKSNEEKNNKYWEKRIASETWKTYNSLEEKNRKLLEFYIEASESVKDELYLLAEKNSKEGILSLSEMHKQNRLTELNKKYEKIIEELGHATEDFAKKNMHQGFQQAYENVAVSMGDVDFSMPNKKLMEKLMDTPWRGDTFSMRLWKNQKKLAVSLNDILLVGLQQGKIVTEIAIMLHNRMGQGFNECHRLVRTEMMHYLNDATLHRYKDAGVKYVQIWAAVDERTCDICGGYHEKIYPIDKCPHVPFHANCRCTILPVTDEKVIAEYEKNHSNELESDIGKQVVDIVTGLSKQRKDFEEKLKIMDDSNIKTLLIQSLERTTVKRGNGRKSKYLANEKVVYLAKNAGVDTLAHELFHEIDDTYGLTKNGMLHESVVSDYKRLQNLSKGYGKSIEEMLYSRYPKMFEAGRHSVRLKEMYRGISDILNGMSGGKIRLGYRHEDRYWENKSNLEREVWAQYGRMLYRNDESIVFAKELFPEITFEVERIIREMIK